MISLHLYPSDSIFEKDCYYVRGEVSFAFIFHKEEVEHMGMGEILKHIGDSVANEIKSGTIQIHLRSYEEETKNA